MLILCTAHPCKLFRVEGLRCSLFFALAALWFPFSALAVVTLDQLEPIDFGTLAISRNDTPYTLSLSHTGNYSFSAAYFVVTPGRPGRYRLRGLPAYQPVRFELADDVLARPGNIGPYLTVTDLPLTGRSTNQAGELEFRLGARLRTDGQGSSYPDSTYTGRAFLRVTIDTQSGPSTTEHELDLAVNLQNTLTIIQEHGMSFGRLAAWGSSLDTASLRIQPNGNVQTSNPTHARLISFGHASAGRFRVTGGAPFAPVTLTLPGTPVMLSHQSATESARFFVDDFAANLSGTPSLNGGGELEFSLGATLKTEQTNLPYLDGNYSGTFSMTVEYP